MSDLDSEISNENESTPPARNSEPAMTPVQKLKSKVEGYAGTDE